MKAGLDPAFRKFLSNVVICSEQGYNKSELERVAKLEMKFDYKNSYIDLIT